MTNQPEPTTTASDAPNESINAVMKEQTPPVTIVSPTKGGGEQQQQQESTSEAVVVDRATRKLEAKKLKQERIAAAGGIRPRKQQNSHQQNDENRRPKKKQKKQRIKSSKKSQQPSPSSHLTGSRFGKVMDQTPCPQKPRYSTLSIALPGSVISNAQTQELRTHLVGQIARAAAIYHVDEIIVYNDSLAEDITVYTGGWRGGGGGGHHRNSNNRNRDRDNNNNNKEGGEGGGNRNRDNRDRGGGNDSHHKTYDPHTFMARIFQYMECPQYLRKHFFPHHSDLQFAGLLPPLDAPHHVRAQDRSEFREGVVLDKKNESTGHSFVNCGVPGRNIEIDRALSPGIRCTIQIHPKSYSTPGKNMQGTVVSPAAPRQKDGTYWGYTTRLASSMKAVFDECPFGNNDNGGNGYDLKIGTSERGTISVEDLDFGSAFCSPAQKADDVSDDKTFQHALIVFGGVAGIEECVDADETTNISGLDSKSLFDHWVNICPHQGSRTIRTEEAVLLGLTRLRSHLFPIHDRSNNSTNMEEDSQHDTKTPTDEDDDATMDVSTAPVDDSKSARNTAPAVEFSDDEPSDESSCEGSE